MRPSAVCKTVFNRLEFVLQIRIWHSCCSGPHAIPASGIASTLPVIIVFSECYGVANRLPMDPMDTAAKYDWLELISKCILLVQQNAPDKKPCLLRQVVQLESP